MIPNRSAFAGALALAMLALLWVSPDANAAPEVVTAVLSDDGARGLSPKVLARALDAVASARSRGFSGRDDLLTVIDYSLPSTKPRLWVLDLVNGKVLFRELVAHGQGSGDNYATRFSNQPDSHQSSLGLFLTAGTYTGGNGYSLKLRGLESGVNDLAESRYIVMHGAWYVSPEHARAHGRIGRSWGCPALPQEAAGPVIDTIKEGSFLFVYGK
ncbi:MAG TPA: murein L,D-transpeptidase catalytic domain family protein [Thermoanaerobaculia bacterium]|jgi:hypothetical protein|nr:murein L,D-transpeptidase catalytic domain family protein [Thermoanaerobaculia bacterium]